MAKKSTSSTKVAHTPMVKKSSSSAKPSMVKTASMNKSKKLSYKKYRGQGR